MNWAQIAFAGICGAAAMAVVMSVIHASKLANADMIRAVGSLVTRDYARSLGPGLVIHFVLGILFAFVYAFLASISPVQGAWPIMMATTAAGFLQGVAVGLLLVVAVAEHHPLEQFRKASFEVVVSHVIGHVTYGVVVGLIFVFLHVDTHLIQV